MPWELSAQCYGVGSCYDKRDISQSNQADYLCLQVRDPRALLAAQKAMGNRKPFDMLCQDLVNVGSMIRHLQSEGVKSAHEVHYEQLATNASYYGAQIYKLVYLFSL